MKRVYSDLIVAYGQGRTVQFQDCTLKDPTEWNDLEADNTVVWPSLLRTDGQPSVCFKFRLKPRTVKIGNREVEAPVLEPVEGQELWFWDSREWEPACWKFSSYSAQGVEQVKRGEWFASEEACKAAYDAYCTALRGES
jgi:hypothetical protein